MGEIIPSQKPENPFIGIECSNCGINPTPLRLHVTITDNPEPILNGYWTLTQLNSPCIWDHNFLIGGIVYGVRVAKQIANVQVSTYIGMTPNAIGNYTEISGCVNTGIVPLRDGTANVEEIWS